jgi:hypothetical protein
MGAGQFSIFGAVEEKSGRGFPELEHLKNSLATCRFFVGWRQFPIHQAAREKTGRVGRGIIHSERTGNAERRQDKTLACSFGGGRRDASTAEEGSLCSPSFCAQHDSGVFLGEVDYGNYLSAISAGRGENLLTEENS